MPTSITEKQVLEMWQDSLQCRTDLLTEENEPVRIIYPGRRNDDRGADFKDAVIIAGRRQLKGDIEIHVKTSNWWSHGHHRDPVYNRVILHVVYLNDSQRAIVRQNGTIAPTLALQERIKYTSPPAPSTIPCRHIFYCGNAGFIGKILDEAGEQRFLAWAAGFKEKIARSGAGQALYQGIMTALGYSKNSRPMQELAGLMPLQELKTAAQYELPDEEYLAQCQALLSGTAGLLPSQCRECHPGDGNIDDWEAKLENIWASSGRRREMCAADWHLYKVRPGNYPVRRIAAMSHLLLRYREKGLPAGLVERLQEAIDDTGSGYPERALLVAPDSYWGRYLDFGVPAQGIAPALLGSGRAVDIVINVILPFICAHGPVKQGERALDIYRHYRVPQENSLVEHMRKQLGISKPFIANARRQQGLIHIYKTLCSQGKCGECKMNTGIK